MPDPSLWGEPFWTTLHYAALGYPTEPDDASVQAYGAFFKSVGHVLPCATCQQNFRRHTRGMPVEPALQQGRDALFEWTVALHNKVNAEHGKPQWSVARAREYYMSGGWRTLREERAATQRTASIALVGANVAMALAVVMLGSWCVLRRRGAAGAE